MIWAGISGRYIFGPYFFESSVNQHTYLTTLKVWLVSELKHMDLMGKLCFQLDTVPAHYTISVQEYLCDISHDKRIAMAHPHSWLLKSGLQEVLICHLLIMHSGESSNKMDRGHINRQMKN
jgi:hypothetical protein